DQAQGGVLLPEGGVVGDQGGDAGDGGAAHGVLVGGSAGGGGGGRQECRARTASASARGTSGTRVCAPSRTMCRPATTVWRTSAAVAARTAVSAPRRGGGPAVLTVSRASVVRSAGAPVAMVPARSQPRAA